MQKPKDDSADNAAVVILGAAVRWNGAPGPILSERIRTGAETARQHPGIPVIVSGGGRGPRSEACVMCEALLALGIDGARIVTEDASGSTLQNAINTARILRNRGKHRVYLVTSAFHMPRAKACFRTAGMMVEPRPCARPVGLRRRILLRNYAKEAVALIRYGPKLLREWQARRGSG